MIVNSVSELSYFMIRAIIAGLAAGLVGAATDSVIVTGITAGLFVFLVFMRD